MAARIAMMAITTSNSMKVKPNTRRAWPDDERETGLFIAFTFFPFGGTRAKLPSYWLFCKCAFQCTQLKRAISKSVLFNRQPAQQNNTKCHHRIHIRRGQKIVHGNAPAAFEFLARPNRPWFGDVEKAEQEKYRQAPAQTFLTQ